jgi:tetratricopeptide (TPR) repeat protein
LCLCCLGNVATLLGNYQEAKQFLQQALVLSKKTGEPKLIATVLNHLSPVVYTLGDSTQAKQYLQESLTLIREISDRWSMIICLNQLGAITYLDNPADWPEAKRLHEESLAIAQELGNPREIAISLNYLGRVTCALADYPAAQQHFLAALQRAAEGQITPIALDALVGLATLLHLKPTGETEADLVYQKEQVVELLALVLSHSASSHTIKDRAQRLLAELKAELPPQVLATAQGRGRARKLEEVVAEILAEKG